MRQLFSARLSSLCQYGHIRHLNPVILDTRVQSYYILEFSLNRHWNRVILDIRINWGSLPLRLSSIEVVFHWGCLPLRLSSIEVVFNSGHLILRSSHIEVLFSWGPLPLRSSSIEVIFNWGRLPLRFSSIKVIFHWAMHSFPAFYFHRWVGCLRNCFVIFLCPKSPVLDWEILLGKLADKK